MFDGGNLEKCLKIFQALGDRNRMRILLALYDTEKCPHQIAEELDLTPSNISHHLGILHERNLVDRRREGKHRYYRMSDRHVEDILEAGVEHASE